MLFFVFVIAGEEPIDHVQRQLVHGHPDLHPLLRRISQIHILEEARHLSFAATLLERRVPRLSPARRLLLQLSAPWILGQMARLMLEIPPEIARTYRIPPEAIGEARRRSREGDLGAARAVARPRRLLRRLGLLPDRVIPLWKQMGVWPDVPRAGELRHTGGAGSSVLR